MSNQFDSPEETAPSYIKLDECLNSIRVQPVNDYNLSTIDEIPKSQYVVQDDGIYLYEFVHRDVCKTTRIMSKQAFVEAFEKYINNK